MSQELDIDAAEELQAYLQLNYSFLGTANLPECCKSLDFTGTVIVGAYIPMTTLLPSGITFGIVRDFAITHAYRFADLTGAPHTVVGNFTIEKNTTDLSLKGLPTTISGALDVQHLDDLGVENWLLILKARPKFVLSTDSKLAPILNLLLQSNDYLQVIAQCSADPKFAVLAERLVAPITPPYLDFTELAP